ncbi:MAG TPA: DUF3418 domain-containing protein, partial [Jatrophihabitantaceae bacterium]|nr:DUF3418 domain-containing protein [Jatrophihabitantaceae bacterium]
AELVETNRLLARVAAGIEPEAVEQLAGHLVVRSYSEPHWDRRRGAVMAYERVTLYGLPLVLKRRVNYANVDPVASRELFIRHALVDGEWDSRHHFFRDNQNLRAELAELEERTRRRDLVAGEDELFDFYDQRIPAEAVSQRHFDTWWKATRQRTPDLLTLTRADLVPAPALDSLDTAHPQIWRSGDLALPLTYRFDPGTDADGVTVHVPVDVLARLGGDEFGWQVPALREELVIALIRSLPKPLRRHFVPVPDTARAVLAELATSAVVGSEPLLDSLQRELHKRTGVLVPRADFDLDKLPPHLRIGFAVEDEQGRLLAEGHDLVALRERLAEPVRASIASALAPELERDGLRDWPADLVELPQVIERERDGHVVRGYPALTVDGIRVMATEAEQRLAMPAGTRALLRGVIPAAGRAASAGLGTRSKLVLGVNPDGGLSELLDDCADAAADQLVARFGVPWSAVAFEALRDRVREELPALTRRILGDVEQALLVAQEVRAALPDRTPPPLAAGVADIVAQLELLLPPGFVAATSAARLRDLTRYLRAVGRRLELLPRDVELDRARMLRVQQMQDAYDTLRFALPAARAAAADVVEIGWQLQELRVSLFAQQLGTPRPVSEQRIYRALDAITP